MKKEHIKKLVNLLGIPVLLIVLGLILAFSPDTATALVSKIIGWVLIVAGIIKVLEIVLDRHFSDVGGWFWTAVELALGVYILNHPLVLAKILGVFLGIVLLSEGVRGIRKALGRKESGGSYQVSLILAVVTLLAGFLLVVTPLTASRVVVSICGVVLIIIGGAEFAERIRDVQRLEDGSNSIIDADE